MRWRKRLALLASSLLVLLSVQDIIAVALVTWGIGKLSAEGDEVTLAFDGLYLSLSVGFVALRFAQDLLAIALGFHVFRRSLSRAKA